MDNKNKKGHQDDSKINANQPYELNYACKKFNVDKETLKAIMKKVGNGRKKLNDYFGK